MGKRLFEQGGDVTPSLDMRLASGKVGTPTANHTWQTVVSWLEAVLNFLKKSENLNDLPDKVIARDNLDVLSSGEITSLLSDKADADNVLALDNTTPFTPSENYHPATNLQIRQTGMVVLGRGWFDANGTRLGWTRNSFADATLDVTTTKRETGAYTISMNKSLNNIFVIAHTNYTSTDSAVGVTNVAAPFALSGTDIYISTADDNTNNDAPVYFTICRITF
jgi:hypothetical protein